METNNNETLEIESEALTDSRTYEKTSSFFGISFFYIIFGRMWGKYESILSIEYEGRAVVIIYPGICLVSKNDTLGITGKWSSGTKYKMKDNIIIASCIENISSRLVFDITGI